MASRLLLAAALLSLPGWAQAKRYSGPRPANADVPYLLHAGQLVQVEDTEARSSQEKGGTLYTISGAGSNIRTPVPEPVFLFKSDKLNPDRFTLFKMESRGANRTLLIPPLGKSGKKDQGKPVFLLVSNLAPGLFKIEVNEVLDPGEYCLSPEGSMRAFCFASF
jgi:hypothetical protein